MKKRLMKPRPGLFSGTFLFIWALLVLISAVFSGLATASEERPYIAVLEKNNERVFFADHNENLTEGNWALLSGGKEILLPQPLCFTYNGTNTFETKGAALWLDVENDTDYFLSYPYLTHPFYTVNDSVKLDFNGQSTFGNRKVTIYLVEMGSFDPKSLEDAFVDMRDLTPFGVYDIFNKSVDSYSELATVTLDENGDLNESLEFGPLPAGRYGVLVMLPTVQQERKLLSATAFEVLEDELMVDAPKSLKEGEDLELSLFLRNASEDGNRTYGALLVNESAYRADIKLSSDGTRAGTSVVINGIDVIDEFGINSTNYRSKLGKYELQAELQALIGEGNGTISIGEVNENKLSLAAFDLPAGNYLLFAGTYEEGKGLVGIEQKELSIIGNEPKDNY